MTIPPAPQVTELEMIDGGAKITFADGVCAVYPAQLLFASLELATIMSGLNCEPDALTQSKPETSACKPGTRTP